MAGLLMEDLKHTSLRLSTHQPDDLSLRLGVQGVKAIVRAQPMASMAVGPTDAKQSYEIASQVPDTEHSAKQM